MKIFDTFIKASCQQNIHVWEGSTYVTIDDGELVEKADFDDLRNIYLNHETPEFSALFVNVESKETFVLVGFHKERNRLEVCFTTDIDKSLDGFEPSDVYLFLVAVSFNDKRNSKVIVSDDQGVAKELLGADWVSVSEAIHCNAVDINFFENREKDSSGYDVYTRCAA